MFTKTAKSLVGLGLGGAAIGGAFGYAGADQEKGQNPWVRGAVNGAIGAGLLMAPELRKRILDRATQDAYGPASRAWAEYMRRATKAQSVKPQVPLLLKEAAIEKVSLESSEWAHYLKENKEFRKAFAELNRTNYSEDQLLDLMDKHGINTSKWRKTQTQGAFSGGGGRPSVSTMKQYGHSLLSGGLQGSVLGSVLGMVTPGIPTMFLQSHLEKNWRKLDKETKKEILERYKARNYTQLKNGVASDAYSGAQGYGAVSGGTMAMGATAGYFHSPKFRNWVNKQRLASGGKYPLGPWGATAMLVTPMVAGGLGAREATRKYWEDPLFQAKKKAA